MATALAENPRAVMGGNNPPIEEQVLLDLDAALLEHDGLIDRIAQFEAKANEVAAEAATLEVDGDKLGPCKTADMAGRYGDFIKMTSTAAKVIEAERETINRPLLTAQRSLKARADSYSQRALAAGEKVRMQLNKYLAEQDRIQRVEAARLAEIARQAEAERQRVIEEANRKARDEAEAERVRLQAIEDERAAKEKREAEAVVVEPEPVFVPEPEPVFAPAAPTRGPIRGDYGTSVSVVETWDIEVENIRQVPDAYLKHPTVIEALEKVIRPQVRGKNGLREIKGCRIFSKLGSAVR
jgi:hypothetical protein